MFEQRLPWLTITPLGSVVDPEVNCSTASVSGPTPGGRQRSASSSGPAASVASHLAERSAGTSATGDPDPSRAAVVRTNAGATVTPATTTRGDRDRHHPGVEATEEGDQELGAGRVGKDRPLAEARLLLEAGRHPAGQPVEPAVGQVGDPPLGLSQIGVTQMVVLILRTGGQQPDDGGYP
jgi:hypothetical protein